MTASTLKIQPTVFRDLISPVLPLVSLDPAVPVLESVLIETRCGYVTATATDRFRIGMSRTETGSPDGFHALVNRQDLELILNIFAPAGVSTNPHLTFTAGGDRLTVTTPGTEQFVAASMTIAIDPGLFPNVESLLRSSLADEPTPEPVAINSELLASFRGAGDGTKDNPIVLRTAGPNRPVLVIGGDDFIGAVMPVKLVQLRPSADLWTQFLTPKEPA